MPIEARKPIRILHVVGGMNRGGVETWLRNVLRHIDRERFRFDFLVHTTNPCSYDVEIRDLGSNIIPCLGPSRPWHYAMNFARIMKEQGPYDVIHSHIHHYSGFVLQQAHKAGVPVRIAHSHSDTSLVDSKSAVLRKAYLKLTEQLIRQYATVGLAASSKAAAALFGHDWKKDPRWRILHCGVDLSPFSEPIKPLEVRRELGISRNAFVVGHVGSFSEPKNHAFLVDIAEYLVRHEPNVRFLLIGDGPLRPVIECKVTKMGLIEHVLFVGLQPDVPRLLLGAMDIFLLPSLFEGLPLALIEAQAAGLPCVLSDVIATEANVVPPLIRRLSLGQPVHVWGDTIAGLKGSSLIEQHESLRIISQSPFNIVESVRQLCDVYCQAFENNL